MSKGSKTQTATVKTPKYQEDAYKKLYSMADREVAKPYVPYTGQNVADRNALQIGAMDTASMMSNQANRFDPTAGLQNLATAPSNSIGSLNYNADLGRIGNFGGSMSNRGDVRLADGSNQSVLPGLQNYLNKSTDLTTDIGLRQLNENRLKQLQQDQDQAIGRGAFSGSRGALLESETNKNFNQQASDFVAQQNQQNFENAMALAGQDKDRQLQALGMDQAVDRDLALANQKAVQDAEMQNQRIGQGYFDKFADLKYAQAEMNNQRDQFRSQMLDKERDRVRGIFNDILGAQQQGLTAQTQQGILAQEQDQAVLDDAYNRFLDKQGYGARNLGLYTSAVSGVPFMGATSTTNRQKMGLGDVLGAGVQLGSAFLMGSDARMKTDVKKLGSINGINIYSWTWNKLAKQMGWDKKYSYNVGVMAQEVKHIPGAVQKDSDGYYLVDYGVLNGI